LRFLKPIGVGRVKVFFRLFNSEKTAMAAKKMVYRDDARDKIRRGVDALADAVKFDCDGKQLDERLYFS
jgi:hypothetical protein